MASRTSGCSRYKLDDNGNTICVIKVECRNYTSKEAIRDEALDMVHYLTKLSKCENWKLIMSEETYSKYDSPYKVNIVCYYQRCYDEVGGSLLS